MTKPPFAKDLELENEPDLAVFPAYLNSTLKNESRVERPDMSSRLSSELLTPDLDQLAPYLWLVGTQQSSHISLLHEQIVKGQ